MRRLLPTKQFLVSLKLDDKEQQNEQQGTFPLSGDASTGTSLLAPRKRPTEAPQLTPKRLREGESLSPLEEARVSASSGSPCASEPTLTRATVLAAGGDRATASLSPSKLPPAPATYAAAAEGAKVPTGDVGSPIIFLDTASPSQIPKPPSAVEADSQAQPTQQADPETAEFTHKPAKRGRQSTKDARDTQQQQPRGEGGVASAKKKATAPRQKHKIRTKG